jgi:hypothetical protein
VASEEERGEVDTYMVLSSYYYDMLAINDTTRHTKQKKNRHHMMLATSQLCWAIVSGRHEDMSSKLTFDDIKNVEIYSYAHYFPLSSSLHELSNLFFLSNERTIFATSSFLILSLQKLFSNILFCLVLSLFLNPPPPLPIRCIC